MAHLIRAMGLGIVVLALVVGAGISGDTKKETGKKGGTLPAGWKALNLTKDQREKVTGIMATYKGKIVALQKQIDDLKSQEKAEMVKVLTDEQKAILLKGLTGETNKKAPPAKDKEK